MKNWSLLIDVKIWFWPFFAPKPFTVYIVGTVNLDWYKQHPRFTHESNTRIWSVFYIEKISDSFLNANASQNHNPLPTSYLSFSNIVRDWSISHYIRELQYEVGRGLWFWSVRIQKAVWNFFNVKHASNQRFIFMGKSRVLFIAVKIYCPNGTNLYLLSKHYAHMAI